MSSAADASWSISAEDACRICGWSTGEGLVDVAAQDPRDDRRAPSQGWVGPNAGLGRIEEKSIAVPVEGIRLRGENAGEVTLVGHPLGSMSGDTEAEYVLPATSPSTSGDDGEGGAGGMRWGTVV